MTFERQRRNAKRSVYEKTREFSERSGVEWHVDEAQVSAELLQPCFLCGQVTGNQQLVRVDTLYGYHPDNIAAACWPCIKLRGDASPAMLLEYGQRWVRNRDAIELRVEQALLGAKERRARRLKADEHAKQHLGS